MKSAQNSFILAIFLIFASFSTVRASNLVDPHVVNETYFRTDMLYVKFTDDAPIRAVNGNLTDLGSGELQVDGLMDLVKLGHWTRVHHVADAELLALRQVAQDNLNRPVPDLRVEFFFQPYNNSAIQELLDVLLQYEVVEQVLAVPHPTEPPLPPNYEPNQGYLDPAGTGLDAEGIWSNFNNRGTGVKVADLEYTFNANHDDLPNVTVVGPAPQDPGYGNDHGTAVLGVIGSINNGWGTTGIASDCDLYFAGTYTNSVWNVGAAITNALTAVGNGDVILLEQQYVGPNGGSNYVPVEWYQPTYNAIVTAVGQGVSVVEAAGNGGENLDGPEFSTGNGGHYPFLPGNSSGAIIVGSANVPAAFGGSDVPRSRRSSSCYGSRVDLQAWGTRVYTTGYGSTYSSEGVNREYTGFFSGTSSASAIIAGGVALFQATYEAFTSSTLTPAQLTAFLVMTGQPQTSGIHPASQNIGPFPDLTAAAQAAVGTPACAEVTVLSESNLTASSVRLNWDPVPNADHYKIRGNVVGASGYVYITIPNGSPNYFDVANLSAGTSYFWQVIAYCSPDETIASNWSAARIFATFPCSTPLSLSTSQITSSSARLNWNGTAGATGYTIRGRALGGPFVTLIVSGGGTSWFDVSGLAGSAGYEWQIKSNCGTASSPYSPLTAFFTTSATAKFAASVPPKEQENYVLYPNPATDRVHLHNDSDHHMDYQVYTAEGKLVASGQCSPGSNCSLPVSGLNNGIYLIHGSAGDAAFVEKLVIQRN